MTKQELLDKLAVLLAGRVAEEIIFGEVSTRAEIGCDVLAQFGIRRQLSVDLLIAQRLGGHRDPQA